MSQGRDGLIAGNGGGSVCSKGNTTLSKSPAYAEERVVTSMLFSLGQPERKMNMLRTIALITAVALSSATAFAQSSSNTAGGSSQAGGPAASKTTTGASIDGTTTGGRGTNMKNEPGNAPMGTTGMGTSAAPSSSGNVGPGTNNNSGPQPGGR